MARYFTRLRLVKYLAISHADLCNKSYIYIYICCNAGRGLGGVTYRGRDLINMNGGQGIPATFEAEAEAACWLEGLAGGTQQQPRGKEASSSKTQECLLTCNRSSQKDGRKLDSKEVKQLTVPCNICRKQRLSLL